MQTNNGYDCFKNYKIISLNTKCLKDNRSIARLFPVLMLVTHFNHANVHINLFRINIHFIRKKYFRMIIKFPLKQVAI